MKALVYKELRLSMHIMCYLFVTLFPLMILIPAYFYPWTIGFIYVLTAYPVLFLGANKGQQSNDLLFSALLPVRKKDIVLARMITLAIMQFTFMAITALLLPIALKITGSYEASLATMTEEELKTASKTFACFPLSSFVLVLAIVLVGFSLADIVFLPIYYKKGKSIVASTLITILVFVTYIAVLTFVIPVVAQIYQPLEWILNISLPIQFACFGGALVIYFLMHWLTYSISYKRLEKVDF